jgi:hypothetical protein
MHRCLFGGSFPVYGPMHSAETTHRPIRSEFVKPAEQCRHNMDTTGHQQEHPKIKQTMLGNPLSEKSARPWSTQQLPPIHLVQTRSARRWLERNAFESVGVRQHIKVEETESCVTFLDTQYRMAPPIADVVSQLAYGGRLVADLHRAIA